MKSRLAMCSTVQPLTISSKILLSRSDNFFATSSVLSTDLVALNDAGAKGLALFFSSVYFIQGKYKIFQRG